MDLNFTTRSGQNIMVDFNQVAQLELDNTFTGKNIFTDDVRFGRTILIEDSQLISNLNADLLDGKHGSEYASLVHHHDQVYMKEGSYRVRFGPNYYLGYDEGEGSFYKQIGDGGSKQYLLDGTGGLTKSSVGLGNVNNWTASDAVDSNSRTTYATSYAVKQAYDKASASTAGEHTGYVMFSGGTLSSIDGTLDSYAASFTRSSRLLTIVSENRFTVSQSGTYMLTMYLEDFSMDRGGENGETQFGAGLNGRSGMIYPFTASDLSGFEKQKLMTLVWFDTLYEGQEYELSFQASNYNAENKEEFLFMHDGGMLKITSM